MNPVTPSIESVFTEEYWGDVQDLEAPGRVRLLSGFISRKQQEEIDELLVDTATGIFRGDEREPVPAGTSLMPSDGNHFTAPGNVLLIDIEAIGSSGKKPCKTPCHERFGGKPVHWESNYMQSPDELLAAPASLFRSNSRKVSWPGADQPQTTVYPYNKKLCQPQSNSHYARIIRLLAFQYDRYGKIAGNTEVVWKSKDPEKVRGSTTNLLGFGIDSIFRMETTIGSSFRVPDKAPDLVLRIKSAELCTQGLLSRVEAKRRHRLPRFAGRLAAAPVAG